VQFKAPNVEIDMTGTFTFVPDGEVPDGELHLALAKPCTVTVERDPGSAARARALARQGRRAAAADTQVE
jgi:hypothetical protein